LNEDVTRNITTSQSLAKAATESVEPDDVLEVFQERAQSFIAHISSIGESLVKTGKKIMILQ